MLVVTVAITGEILPKSKATEETSDQQVEKESKKLTFKHVIQVFWFCLLGYVSQSSFPYCLHVCVRVLSLAPDRNLINAGLSQPLMEFTIYIALFFRIPTPRKPHPPMSGLLQPYSIMDPLNVEQKDFSSSSSADS